MVWSKQFAEMPYMRQAELASRESALGRQNRIGVDQVDLLRFCESNHFGRRAANAASAKKLAQFNQRSLPHSRANLAIPPIEWRK